ncbi:MAG: hypothetical protein IJ728_10820 [Selenomonadaceae bacterium]|nr:hypothetical protein [Selenomonadaceae bacterium]
MSKAPFKNKKYAYLLNDIIKFSQNYDTPTKKTGVQQSSVKFLYTTLVNYCNTLEWQQPFEMSDRFLSALTSLDKRTITKARKVLIDLEKIYMIENGEKIYYAFYSKDHSLEIDFKNIQNEAKKVSKAVENSCKSSEEMSNSDQVLINSCSTSDQVLINSCKKSCARVDISTPPNSQKTASNQAKLTLLPTTTTTTPTTTTTSITTSINQQNSLKKSEGEELDQNDHSETFHNSNSEKIQDRSIDRFFLKEKEKNNLGANGSPDTKKPQQLPKPTTTQTDHPDPTTQQPAISQDFKLLVQRYGQDTVNQACYQVKQQQERTGRTDLLTNFKYMETTCQRILGMKPTEDFERKPRDKAGDKTGTWRDDFNEDGTNKHGFLPMDKQGMTEQKTIDRFNAEYPGVMEYRDETGKIHYRSWIFSEAFDANYNAETDTVDYLEIVKIMKEAIAEDRFDN